MKNLIFNIEGINCGSCIKKIETNLSEMENLSEVVASKDEQSVKVTGSDELSAMSVKAKLEELGFPVVKMSKA